MYKFTLLQKSVGNNNVSVAEKVFHTTKFTSPRHRYAAAITSWAFDAPFFKFVFQPVTKITNEWFGLNSGSFHSSSGLVNGIDIEPFFVCKMNDISSTFGVNFDLTSTEFELSAIVPKIRTEFAWNFYVVCVSEEKRRRRKRKSYVYVQNWLINL